jgi:hypothetical protein
MLVPMRTLIRAVGLGAAMSSGGCFNYVPLTPPSPELKPGSELRAALEPPERLQLSEVAVDNVAVVQGEFVQWEADSLMMSVLWLQAGSGAEHLAHGETIVVPLAGLGRLERKSVSLPRTLGLLGVAVLGSALLSANLTGGARGNPGGPGPVPPR